MLLLLDEPTAGLAPVIVQTLANKIRELKEKGLTVLLTEQNADFALSVSDRAYAIDKGSVVHEGTPDHWRHNEDLMQRLLGVY
jgi:branched-chain amino acid transport system ATP-binding protein